MVVRGHLVCGRVTCDVVNLVDTTGPAAVYKADTRTTQHFVNYRFTLVLIEYLTPHDSCPSTTTTTLLLSSRQQGFYVEGSSSHLRPQT